MTQNLYLGFDLSTQGLKGEQHTSAVSTTLSLTLLGVAITSSLELAYEAKVDFDADLGAKYGLKKGVRSNDAAGEVFAPVEMWFDAVDLVLSRLKAKGCDFSHVKGLSGAGMQHGTMYWSHDAERLLSSLKGDKSLHEQLYENGNNALSHANSPNWQDASTQRQCDAFDACLGNADELASITGSKAHHRFSGPQIMRFREKFPEDYARTARISLVSSFIASILLGKVANIDIGDVCGMNLYEIKKGDWNEDLLALTAGGCEGVEDLKRKLGSIDEDGGGSHGRVSRYYVERYGFNPDCRVSPCTGDNPSTILSLPLRPHDAIVSLGTSSTFLMSTPKYQPDPSYHFMNHPTTAGLYMFMLCYKNGGLAREEVRDKMNDFSAHHPSSISSTNSDIHCDAKYKQGSWDLFNETALAAARLGAPKPQNPYKMGLYFPRQEIVPNIPPGHWTFTYDPKSKQFLEYDSDSDKEDSSTFWQVPHDHARSIVESQFLSMRLRAHNLVHHQTDPETKERLPPQPRRIYLVGGGSANPAIAQICGEVLGGAEGIYRLELGGNACALGSAHKAVWALERKVHGKGEDGDIRGGRDTETFEEMIGARWQESSFISKMDQGYRKEVFERYGEALEGLAAMEKQVEAMTSSRRSSGS